MSADPSPNPTPPPGASGPPAPGGPTPQIIARAFIKQYYKTLLGSPSNLNGFYQPDSTVSRGMEPSSPAIPSAFNMASSSTNGDANDSPGERARKAFFEWAGNGNLQIDFQRGAIDAQESIGGGILVVVTGHMTMPGSTMEKPFVQTFFLNNAAGPGRKKHFLVKNDMLRFLDPVVVAEEELVEEVAEVEEEAVEEEPAVEEPAVVEEPVSEPSPAGEPVPVEPVQFEPSADEEKVEDEEGGVEETEVEQPTIEVDPAAEEEKEENSSEAGSDASPAPSPTGSEGSKKKRNRKKRGGKSRSRSKSPKKGDAEEEEPEKPKTPGSWASLVASGAPKKSPEDGSGKKGKKGSSKPSTGGGSDKASSNQESPAKAPPQSQPAKESSTQASSAVTSSSSSNNRTPQATLFIRNIPDKTTEAEIRTMFEPFGPKTNTKMLGITLNTNRGFCFVDFDSPAAISAIVEESAKSLVKDPRTGRKVSSTFMAQGRVLDVERKVPSDRNKQQQSGGGGRRFNRSHSPKDGGGRYRGSRGGMRRSPPRGGGGGNR